jgi:signal transduction histidine kinase
MIRHLIAAAAALCFILPAWADDRATTKEAEVMVHKAVDYLKANGREKALANFSDPQGNFTYRDLYVFALDTDGVMKAHGRRPDFIGKNHANFKDADGKAFNQELLQLAKTKGKGWVEYKMQNPVNGKTEQKVVYFELVDGLVIGCGAFLK